MKNRVPSTIAENCAAIRASHFIHGHRPLIVEDPVAIELINQDLRKICLEGNKFASSGGASLVIGRARYTEDLLELAVNSGVKQYVILGAGLDTFALRRADLVKKLRVYEVDHPNTQQWKCGLQAKLDREAPPELEFIPADLENESVTKALDRSSFRHSEPAFFSWLGTLPYLTHEAIINTLGSIAGTAAVGSEIVFDYRVSMDFVDPEDIEIVKAGDKATAAAGEPKRSFLNPHIFLEEIIAMGYEVVESLTPQQMAQRYFTGRNDVVRPTSHHYYAHLKNLRSHS